MQKTRKFMIAFMAAMMVFAFGAANAFAAESPWTWSEDGTTATYTDTNGTWDADMSQEDVDATCTNDAYTIYTATYKGNVDTNIITQEDTKLGHLWSEPTPVAQKVNNTYTDIYATFECEREGCDAVAQSSTVRVKNADADVVEASCWEDGGASWDVTVKFEGKNVPITATRYKESSPSHNKAHKVEHHEAVAPTCESDGVYEYWYCTEDEIYFVEEELMDGSKIKVEVTEDGIVDPKIGHDYQVKYTFAEDGSECVAKAECKRANCDSFISEKATITSEVTKQPTSTEMGETTYTATFENEVFATQTKVVADVPYIYEPSWSDDYTKCVAKCKGKEDVDAESVTRTAEAGVITYTATFAEGKNIGPFTVSFEQENPMVAKAKTVKAKASKKTTVKASKAFKVTGAEGDVTFEKQSGNAKIKVSKTGKVTVKKGLKKGKTYKVKVLVKAAGNDEYKAGEQTVILKVKIPKK